MATQIVSENSVFKGDLIVTQSEVLFFKKKKKKKKTPTPTRCILLATNNYVAFTQNNADHTEILGFATNTITDFTYTQPTQPDSNPYKLEISVFIKHKTHQLCIEFPTHNGNNAEKERDKFIQYFTSKTTNKTSNHKSPSATSNTATPPSPSSRRGIKRKRDALNDETLRSRAKQLADQKYLATLYKTLVGQNVLTADEFWDEYGTDMDSEPSNGLTQGMSNTALQSTVQRELWSLFSVFKDDINNAYNVDSDDNNHNKLTINLTAEKILEIFIHLPHIKLAYDQSVPSDFSEVDFWTAFLQSQYFKRETTKNGALSVPREEANIDVLLKQCALQIENEDNKSVSASAMDVDEATNNKEDSDVEIMDENGRIVANKPLKRKRFKKKLRRLDPSVDLASTMESFTEVIGDPGTEEHKDMQRDNVQNWFNQVNQHGTMLLYQSLNQRQDNTNADIHERMTHIPKVHYGRTHDEKDTDIQMNEHDNAMEMDYDDRLNLETEFEDLMEDTSNQYIELQIRDQSAYYHDRLKDKEMEKMNDTSVSLHKYLEDVTAKKKKLRHLQVQNVLALRFVEKTVHANTENNAAFGSAKLASERMIENRQNHEDEQQDLKIFTQSKEIMANTKILEQLLEFQKPMKELVRHYWHCFPANPQRLRKAKILVKNIKEFQTKLMQFQMNLDRKSNMDYKMQKVLLQELIDLATKVLDHHHVILTRSQTS
eukprot:6775_1